MSHFKNILVNKKKIAAAASLAITFVLFQNFDTAKSPVTAAASSQIYQPGSKVIYGLKVACSGGQISLGTSDLYPRCRSGKKIQQDWFNDLKAFCEDNNYTVTKMVPYSAPAIPATSYPPPKTKICSDSQDADILLRVKSDKAEMFAELQASAKTFASSSLLTTDPVKLAALEQERATRDLAALSNFDRRIAERALWHSPGAMRVKITYSNWYGFDITDYPKTTNGATTQLGDAQIDAAFSLNRQSQPGFFFIKGLAPNYNLGFDDPELWYRFTEQNAIKYGLTASTITKDAAAAWQISSFTSFKGCVMLGNGSPNQKVGPNVARNAVEIAAKAKSVYKKYMQGNPYSESEHIDFSFYYYCFLN